MPRIGALIGNEKVCTGCQACVVTCSFFKENRFGLTDSRVWIGRNEPTCSFTVHFCRHCGNAPCQQACSTGAIQRNKNTGIMHVLRESCNGCGLCMDACPFDAIRFNRHHVATMCDLCDGQPICAFVCQPKALSYVSK